MYHKPDPLMAGRESGFRKSLWDILVSSIVKGCTFSITQAQKKILNCQNQFNFFII